MKKYQEKDVEQLELLVVNEEEKRVAAKLEGSKYDG